MSKNFTLLVDDANKTSYKNEEIINTVIWGDALSVLPELPTESADMIFIDPPYFLQTSNQTIPRWGSKTTLRKLDENWDKFSNFADYDNFMTSILQECKRIMKRNATIWVMGSFQNISRICVIMQNLGFWILTQFVWMKTNPTPNFLNRRPTNATEFILWAVKDKSVKDYTYNHELARAFSSQRYKIAVNIWELPACSGRERLKDENGKTLHPTQKPEALLERAILISTKDGDLILDPLAGTGTTAAVAVRYNRRFLLIEKEEKYIKGIMQRLNERNFNLFSASLTDDEGC